MSIFAGKTLMITGGTGSFGNAVLNRFLKTDIWIPNTYLCFQMDIYFLVKDS